MMKKTNREPLSLRASDGHPLAAMWWRGADAEERSVVLLPGLAVPQSYTFTFAQFLADSGFGVLTFDYRGVGGSDLGAADEGASLDDWAMLDLPVAVAAVRERVCPRFLGIFAHSIGGQLLGRSPAARSIDGAVLLAAQRGMPTLYSGTGWWLAQYAYAAFPLLIRMFGRLPVGRFTFRQRCPSAAVLQWVRWGRTGEMTDNQGVRLEGLFAEFDRPLVSISIDDDVYASRRAVDALIEVYEKAPSRREHIFPSQYGVAQIGHFGFFHRRAPKRLWLDAINWLRELEAQVQAQSDLTKPNPSMEVRI